MPNVPVIAEGLFSYQFGGSETVGVDLALEFQRRGYRVVCFAFLDSAGPMREKLEAAGVRCLDMNYQRFKGVLRRLHYYRAFWEMLRREKVTALHVHHHGSLILCGIPGWLAGVSRIVMTEHGLQALVERADARSLTRRYGRLASAITAVEQGQIEFFKRELGFASRKLHCIPNGVRIIEKDAERALAIRSELAIPAGVFAFFYVGRLNPVKDIGTLLKAFAALPAEISSVARLYLVGDGTERAKLEELRNALGLTARVTFFGARTDVARVLQAADTLVLSSKSEGLPMVLLEAMAAGVPCISTAVGGIPELFGTDRGLLVPAENASALASAMTQIVTSPEQRRRLSELALQNVRAHYALETIADRYLDLLGLARRHPYAETR